MILMDTISENNLSLFYFLFWWFLSVVINTPAYTSDLHDFRALEEPCSWGLMLMLTQR